MAELKDMLGKTMASVENVKNLELVFTTTDGNSYKLHHEQNCCESVTIESIVGDLNDLIGEPLLMAEESTGETPADYTFTKEPESHTWTFYKFATRKGYVDVRWLGESNGCYSERVNFAEVAPSADAKNNQRLSFKRQEMMRANNFEILFTDAVSGLTEYYEILSDSTVVDNLRIVIAEHYDETDGGQADYEVLRDRIEKLINAEEDAVRDDLRDSVRRIQSGGHALPKGSIFKM